MYFSLVLMSALVTLAWSQQTITRTQTFSFRVNLNDLLPVCKFDTGNHRSNCISTRQKVKCDAKTKYRSFDGTCNNLLFTTRGASNTPLRRLVGADYIDGGKTPRGAPCRATNSLLLPYNVYQTGYNPLDRWSKRYPTAHQVSRNLFQITTDNVRNMRGFSTMFMTFGQFLDHDVALVPHESCKTKDCSNLANSYKYPCFPIKFENDKPECTGFARSRPACHSSSQGWNRNMRNQVNTISSYVDASQVYGNNDAHAKKLRTLDGTGKLKISNKGLLPLDLAIKDCKTHGGCSLVGDERGDENIALHSMHTLWVREHNRVAIALKKLNPKWSEDQLYNTARKINSAVFQHIVYTEWLPNIVKLPKYSHYNPYYDSSMINAFAAAAFRFGHSLIPNAFSQVDMGYNKMREDMLLQKAFFNTEYIHKYGIEATLMGLAANQSKEVNMQISEGIGRKLFIPFGKAGYDDLAARNIQRGRDHGVHVYGVWRKRCNLPAVNTFDDLKKYMQKGASEVFQKLYTHPNDIDLFAAGLSETHLPGLMVGPTFSCIFKHQFTGIREGDRFYYESKDVFTPAQLAEIKKMSLSKVLCNNLKGSVSIQRNVFKVFNKAQDKRVTCSSIPGIDLKAWSEESQVDPKPTTCNIGNTYSNCINVRRRPTRCNLNSPYRTYDGTCNHPYRTNWGAANTALRRVIKASYADGYDTPRGFPCNPSPNKKFDSRSLPTSHQVSRNLFKITTENVKNQHSLSTLYMTFGQFLDHDITLTPHESCKRKDCSNTQESNKYPCFPIKFENDKPVCTGFARSRPACRRAGDHTTPRDQINQISAFVDASNIYGSSATHARRLRTLDGTGKLKLTGDGLMPRDPAIKDCKTHGGCSLVGDERGDENIALHSMHTLWVREHNRVATELKKLNPKWTEEKLYQESRKIVSAEYQHIVYNEYVPKLAQINPYRGYSPYIQPSIINVFATAAFRFGHSLVPNAFSQLDKNFNKVRDSILLQKAFFNIQPIKQHGIESTMIGLMANQSNEVNMQFPQAIGRKLFIPFGDRNGYDDLMARNIQRGRDHGLPTYGEWRRVCRLPALNSFNDLNRYMQKGAKEVFEKLYKHPNDIDIFAAGISENHSNGKIVGETFSCILRFQFQALRNGDRYFYAKRDIFRSAQLKSIQKTSLAKVMCNNLKDLVSVQKDVFHSYYGGAKRVECSTIPDLDLSLWVHKQI
ncbi:uncharacterized protein [Clytia hemisphaerica]|uniref:Uncharacterized protein n=1 Tax=Clytia hemisphaerica TaxID=252671 RepID=A0A7M5WJ18_9CNID